MLMIFIHYEEKWLSDEASQTVEKIRDMEGEGAKERRSCLNAEFQR